MLVLLPKIGICNCLMKNHLVGHAAEGKVFTYLTSISRKGHIV